MIKIVYNIKENAVTIEGHAHSAEYGHDLVCAAVSALALTLATNVEYMQMHGAVEDAVINLTEGRAEISCKVANSEHKAHIRQMFTHICVGFEALSERYPKFITYDIEG